MKTRLDFVTYELDWFATDAEGCVALFASAGYGPVPDLVFEHFEAQQAIEKHLCALAGVEPCGSNPETFNALHASGIFCFDWDNTFGPYRRHGTLAEVVAFPQLKLLMELQPFLIPLQEIRFRFDIEIQAHQIPSFTDARR